MIGFGHHRAMPGLDHVTRALLRQIAPAIMTTRTARRWSQRRLARAAGVGHSTIARIERLRCDELPLATVARVLGALDVKIDLRLIAPTMTGPAPVRDRRHARAVAYVTRRLTRAGFDVATEVEVGDERWRGFIDILAFHPVHRLLLVIEVKTAIVDVGGTERQIAAHERAA